MKKFLLPFFILFSLTFITKAQEIEPPKPQEIESSKPKVGRYIQISKGIKMRLGSDSDVSIQLTSVDVLNEKEMKINFIISNTVSQSNRIQESDIPPFYIVDENLTKYQPLGKLKANWAPHPRKEGFYILGHTEKVEGSITFPVLVEGARKFDLYIGYEVKLPDIQLIE